MLTLLKAEAVTLVLVAILLAPVAIWHLIERLKPTV